MKIDESKIGSSTPAAQGRDGVHGHEDSVRRSYTGRQRSQRYVWYVIFLLFTVNIFNYMDRMALAVLAPSIKEDLELSDSQLGLLIGFAFSLFYAICGIPIARWADRGTRRNIIAMALAMWSFMTALSGIAQNYGQLFLARIGVGAGEAGCLPAAQSLVCDYVPTKSRSGVFAILDLGLFAGMMLGMALAGWLSDAIGWRSAFIALGLPGLILAIAVKLTVREPIRGAYDAAGNYDGHLSLGPTIVILLRCRTYRSLIVFLMMMGFVQFGMNQWWPSYYERLFGLSVSSVGLYLGMAIGAGSSVGIVIGGLLANRAARQDISLPLKISAAATFLALPAAVGSILVSSALTSMILVLLAALFWSVSNGPVLATLYSVVAPRMRATAGALSMFCTSVVGLGLGPFLVGILSDTFTPLLGTAALRYALLLPACLIPAVVLALLRAARALPTDIAGGGQVDSARITGRPRESLAAAE